MPRFQHRLKKIYFYKIARSLNDNSVKQIINEYTRVVNTSRITNYVNTIIFKTMVQNCNRNLISDHDIIRILIKGRDNKLLKEKWMSGMYWKSLFGWTTFPIFVNLLRSEKWLPSFRYFTLNSTLYDLNQ